MQAKQLTEDEIAEITAMTERYAGDPNLSIDMLEEVLTSGILDTPPLLDEYIKVLIYMMVDVLFDEIEQLRPPAFIKLWCLLMDNPSVGIKALDRKCMQMDMIKNRRTAVNQNRADRQAQKDAHLRAKQEWDKFSSAWSSAFDGIFSKGGSR
tara:strand:+ start:3588 stop:4043 length:456 start_codon:yes stop_codon:yes gene_type:complete